MLDAAARIACDRAARRALEFLPGTIRMDTRPTSRPHPAPPAANSGPAVRALVVEDDPSISDFIRLGLRYEGFDVHPVADGLAALRTAERLRPDVVVLDRDAAGDGRARGLPAAAGLVGDPDHHGDRPRRRGRPDRRAGDRGRRLPGQAVPFPELVARIRAVLRGAPRAPAGAFRFLDLELNPDTREVSRGGQAINLTPREFDLLHLFMEQPRRVYPKSTILERVWGYDYAGDDNIVEVYVGYLRDKLGDRSGRA